MNALRKLWVFTPHSSGPCDRQSEGCPPPCPPALLPSLHTHFPSTSPGGIDVNEHSPALEGAPSRGTREGGGGLREGPARLWEQAQLGGGVDRHLLTRSLGKKAVGDRRNRGGVARGEWKRRGFGPMAKSVSPRVRFMGEAAPLFTFRGRPRGVSLTPAAGDDLHACTWWPCWPVWGEAGPQRQDPQNHVRGMSWNQVAGSRFITLGRMMTSSDWHFGRPLAARGECVGGRETVGC